MRQNLPPRRRQPTRAMFGTAVLGLLLVAVLGLMSRAIGPTFRTPPTLPPTAPLLRPAAHSVLDFPTEATTVPTVAAAQRMPAPPNTTPTATDAPPPTLPPEAGSDLDRYRRWIHEARQQYPYPEGEAQMVAVLLCESSGNAAISSPDGLNHGLFQYNSATWGASWNPYRTEDIFDAHAQIFATARAWQLGMQGQWGCYGAP